MKKVNIIYWIVLLGAAGGHFQLSDSKAGYALGLLAAIQVGLLLLYYVFSAIKSV